MKSGKSIIELAQELDRQSRAKRDFIASAAVLDYDGASDSLLVPGQGYFPVSATAHDQLGTHLGIPAKYYDRMRETAPALLSQNINTWLKDSSDRRMVRTMDGKVRAFLSDKYRPLDNLELMESVLPTISQEGFRVESCEVTDRKLYLKVVTDRVKFEIVKGDVVQAGLVISNSEIGHGSLSVEPLLYRLVCTNGMIANDSRMRKYHVGRGNGTGEGAIEFFRDETRLADDKAFWMKVADTVSGAMSQINFSKIAEKFFAAKEDKIESDPVEVMEVFSKQYALNQPERNGVLAHLLSGGELSKFGLVNAITRHAQDVTDYDRATQFERLGGEVLELPRSEWTNLVSVQ